MNINKKFNRFQQWGREKMGAEIQTGTTEDFRALETEMNLRHEGMEKLHSSMNTYVKSLSKRSEGDGRDKNTPVGYLGQTMTRHGEVFEDGSQFGQCLISFGQANERIARLQDAYAGSASETWLDSNERSLAQMKEYQNSRKKLDSRRLAYDTAQAKMQKARRDDYRAEEEVRAQKAKFEEATEEVHRRMYDIVETENDSIVDLYGFLEAEIAYHDRCREVLINLRAEWPAGASESSPPRPSTGRASRSTTNLSRFPTNDSFTEDLPSLPIRPSTSRNTSGASTPRRDLQSFELASKPSLSRSTTTDLPSSTATFSKRPPVPRIATEASVGRSQLRPMKREPINADEYLVAEPDESPDRSSSPATSYGTGNGTISRNTSWSTLDGRSAVGTALTAGMKKAPPPPPPPSRASKPKPPPPPPPMKRGITSS